MTTGRLSPCAVCGRQCVHELCRHCIRAGYRASSLWCDCAVPEPDPNGVCRACGRWQEGAN